MAEPEYPSTERMRSKKTGLLPAGVGWQRARKLSPEERAYGLRADEYRDRVKLENRADPTAQRFAAENPDAGDEDYRRSRAQRKKAARAETRAARRMAR